MLVRPPFRLGSVSGGYQIGRSCLFNDDDSAFLSRTPTTSGDRRRWTFSAWVKRATLTDAMVLFSAENNVSSSHDTHLILNADDTLQVEVEGGSGGRAITNAVFRDASAWLHIVVQYDSTAPEIKVSVNNIEMSFSSYTEPPTNHESPFNLSGRIHAVGAYAEAAYRSGTYFDGYLADVYFIDGQSLSSSYFGEVDENGFWVPKAFYLNHCNVTSGTSFGNMTSAGGIAAAFDGEQTQAETNSAGISSSPGYVGKDFGVGTAVSEVRTYAPSDYGYDTGSGSNNIRIRIYGSNSAPSGATDGTLVHDTGYTSTQNNTDARSFTFAETTYRYWWVTLDNATAGNVAIAELEFWGPGDLADAYGTNGFRLTFADSTDLGKDMSGNGNDLTSSGLTSDDQVSDSPTNNHCTINPLDHSHTGYSTLSNGNLDISWSNDTYYTGTFGVTAGKWYWEWTCVAEGASMHFPGWVRSETIHNGYYDGALYRSSDGAVHLDEVSQGTYTNWGTGDVIGVAIDVDAGTAYWYLNGTLEATLTGLSAEKWFPAIYGNSGSASVNFGQKAFAHTPPTGFKALCTANLPDPAIINPTDYFDAQTYAGTGASLKLYTDFAPDLLIGKVRSTADHWGILDTKRGPSYYLSPNYSGGDDWDGSADLLSSFDADGVTVAPYVSKGFLNYAGRSFVAYMMKKGAIPGFDIVAYSGTGSSRMENHDLGVTPEFILLKSRSASQNWQAWHKDLPANSYSLALNSNGGQSVTSIFNDPGAPTATQFPVSYGASTNGSGSDYIAYLFASVPGFSKIGSYTGNGSTDGPFVWCGFRPAFVLVKRIDGTGNWAVFDGKREGYNDYNDMLILNGSDVEANRSAYTDGWLDILSNGFKNRSTSGSLNTSGGKYLFMAFAEAPFKYANAR